MFINYQQLCYITTDQPIKGTTHYVNNIINIVIDNKKGDYIICSRLFCCQLYKLYIIHEVA